VAPTTAHAAGLGSLLSSRFVPVAASALPSGGAGYGDGVCPSESRCYMVGVAAGHGIVTSTRDGAHTWSTSTIAGTSVLNAIACPSASTCFIGGNSTAGGAAILVTQDGGATWVAQQVPAGVFIASISCGSASACIAVGSPPQSQTSSSSTVINTRDGGATWALAGFVSSTPTSTRAQGLSLVRCVDTGHCWVGGPGALFTSDLGASWQDSPLPGSVCPPGTRVCNGIWSETVDIEFESATNGWVIGGEQCGGLGVTQCPGAAFHTSDGGASWTLSPGSQMYPFSWQIACQGSTCLMVTQAFTHTVIVDTNNGGASWSTMQQLPTEIYALACSPSRSFCVAAGGLQNNPALLTLRVAGSASGSGSGSSGGGGPATSGAAGAAGGVSAPGAVVSPLGTSLATPAALSAAPLTALLNALVVLALILLVTFPSHLFNRTYDENHDTIQAWFERRFAWMRGVHQQTAAVRPSVRTTATFVAVLVVGALLATLLDPQAGLSLRSLALFCGAVLALTAGAAVTAAAAGIYRTVRREDRTWQLRALPSGLLVAGLCVLISRLTAFQPGYLYGLIGGVAFAGRLGQREQGREVAVASVAMLAVSVAAWLVWVPLSSAANAQPTNFVLALLENFLAALFVSGMVGLLIGLVPLRFLPGEKLARWHWGAWGAVFGVTALAVLEVMLAPQSSAAHVAGVPFWTTLGLFLGFGIASVSFWGYFRLRRGAA
jgi:hypothetical protein